MFINLFRIGIAFLCINNFISTNLNAQSATEIVSKAYKHERGTSSFAEMTILVNRPKWTRELALKVWSQGSDQGMVLITAPVRERGVVYLKRKKEVWNWIPSIERNIKLPPSMMAQSWMGTDFTNDDLVKEASIVEDYTHYFEKDTTVLGRLCYQIRMVPKQDAGIVWGKVVLSVDKKESMVLSAIYFDDDYSRVSTLSAKEVALLGGRMLPSVVEMVPADKKGHSTVMTYKSLVFDIPIKPDFFSTANMPFVK